MAVDLNKLIDLNLLTRYDNNLKSWILNQIGAGQGIVFAPRDSFPQVGENNVLYVDDDKIYRWDQSTQDYKIINPTSSGGNVPLEWEEIKWR